MMQINITELKDIGDSLIVTEELPIPSLAEFSGIKATKSPMTVEVTVTRSDKGYLVQGEFQVNVELVCNRCLTSFEHLLLADLVEEHITDWNEQDEDDFEALLNKPAVTLRGSTLDITALVNESLLLAIPMKATCEKDCQGICPQCGQNLNEKTCQCVIHKPDPRLAPLADLLKKQ